ncbi:branched-chain amino acid ABC transporter substrate-binding protein [Amantichitinum ursilacus]|uniref:Leucine-, isoleucine-, valine-, threonine-, and alanine-binding protein n=1 Tax=Amantichitinum ursilacus TaxID=857265 RepID=A0A0N0XJ79_9NEIS|nr:branched-chain amino acid ABC transporter substrate-binding protein [Amantichitinum ursilacus]KPC51955.1 Leucine-, isoleucine-, valine-, threonine-, and alanine-binding protein precursor [Amantichitinum ursilacus]
MTIARYSLIAAAIVGLAACGKQETATPDASAPAASAPAAAAAPAGGDATTVKIGHAAPLTGNIAHLGKDNEDGVKLAIDEINAAGGADIGGKKVKFEMDSEDDQADPKTANTVAQRFVDEKVVGVIGHLNSGTTIPASKLYAAAGIPQISPSATAVAYTAAGLKTAFRVMANDAQQGKVLGEYAVKKLNAKKVAIIDDRTAYGQGLADEFEKAAKAAGGEVVGREFTTNQETDFNAILTSIKGKKPDLIFYGGMDAQAGPLKKQARKLGMDAKIMGGDGTQTPELIKLAGDDAEGMVSSSPGQPKDQLPGGKEFLAKFKQTFGQDVQLYAPYCYDAVKVMVEAMKKAGSTEPAKYLPELAKIHYDGVTGPIEFDEKGDIKNGAITLYTVKGGKWEVLEIVQGAAK